LRFLFSFQGRIGRYDYVVRFLLPLLIIEVAVGALAPPLQFNMIMVPIILVSVWPSLAVGAKRCHDRGRSGWFQLVILLPIVGLLWLLIELVLLPGLGDQIDSTVQSEAGAN